MARHMYCGTVVAAEVLIKWGFKVSPKCPLAGDNVFHRIWECPHGQQARDEFGEVFTEQAKQLGQGHP
eukprot:8082104-Pyramimonas_sp.AAC.1